jgi:hypothetical protein
MGCIQSKYASKQHTPDSKSAAGIQLASMVPEDPPMRPPTPHPHSERNLSSNIRPLVPLSTVRPDITMNTVMKSENGLESEFGADLWSSSEFHTSRRRSGTGLVDVIKDEDTNVSRPYIPIGPRLAAPRPLLPREKSISWFDGYLSGERGGCTRKFGRIDSEDGKKTVDRGAEDHSPFNGNH